MQLVLPHRVLDLSEPCVMGVLNVTPDSFSDGGRHQTRDAAVAHALQMVAQGARIVDIGGESSRPGASPVSEEDELARVIPVVEALRACSDVVISVDTTKPAVMRAACAAGADIINDINALQTPGALEVVADAKVAVCLMHMQGRPQTMQTAPRYDDVVREVREFLAARIATCRAAGIGADRIAIDPGIGFGKTLEHNLTLLANLRALQIDPHPLLVGVSRKSMFGQLLGRPLDRRLAGSLAAAAIAVWQGAAIVRAHDVAETVDAIRTATEIRRRGAAP
ncbi:dihydropteroate synthase [Sinimarinibacterium thermocellulolyticum]|uniref:Dihydropteroate synthase n=1 Tax=Sinimarinibacterium thermocellulolyticum TaxID=3170016 RepID=A0ABV2AAI7_9GAMM